MTEAEKLRAQMREFPEAMEIIGRIRAALAESLFLTPIGAKDERGNVLNGPRIRTLRTWRL
jgi:hypothetical protein